MGRVVYSFFGTTIAVAADQPAVLAWIDEFLTPSFRRSEAVWGDFSIEVHTDPSHYERLTATRPPDPLSEIPCFALDQSVISHPYWETEGRTIIDDQLGEALYVLTGTRAEVVSRPGSLRFRTGVMRVIREIAAARALADVQRLQLHTSALSVDEQAVLFAGPKGTGKTTFLVHVAGSTGSPILTNDRAILSFSESSIGVRGVPTIVSLHRDTVELMPAVIRRVPERAHTSRLTLAEADAAARTQGGALDPATTFRLSPPQLARATGTQLAACAPLGAIVFPRRHSDPAGVTIDHLSAAQAEAWLLSARFGLHAPTTGPTVFDQFTGSHRPRHIDRALIARLASAAPSFVVRLGSMALGQRATADAIVTTVLAPPAPARSRRS